MAEERRGRAGGAEEAVDPNAAQAVTIYRCVCGAERQGAWPDCAADVQAFNAPEHQAKLASGAVPENVAAPAPARRAPREL